MKRIEDVETLRRVIDLLNHYGTAKFGDEWWPGAASHWLDDGTGEELEELLERV